MNKKLFNKVLDRIQLDPAGWDQSVYDGHNGTNKVHCFGGWVVILDGQIITSSTDTFNEAMRLLEITYNQAHWLFDTPRTIKDFIRVKKYGFFIARLFS